MAGTMGSTLQIGSTPYVARWASMNSPISAVGGRAPHELRRCEKRRRLAQNLIGAAQLESLALELFEPLPIVGRQAGTRARVDLRALYPMAQCLS